MANIIIATGGTGGHIFPARCLAEELTNHQHRVIIFADKNYLKYVRKDDKFGFKIISGSQAKKTLLGLVIGSSKIIYGVLQSLIGFLFFRPQVIVAFGGYATFSPLIAAVIAGKKIILHEQNAYLGKVNRVFARFADKIILSFDDIKGIDNKFGDKKIMIGNLVRKEITDLGLEEYKLPALDDKNQIFNILIIGGSGGAKIFSDVVPGALANLGEELRKKIHITQQCRKELLEYSANQYKALNINAELSHFFDEIEQKIKAAHLVIARAGSSSIFELCAAKRPMILVPFANSSDNHQRENAYRIKEKGAAIVIEEPNFTTDALYMIIKKLVFDSPDLLLNFSKQGLLCINQNASKDLAKIALNYCTANK